MTEFASMVSISSYWGGWFKVYFFPLLWKHYLPSALIFGASHAATVSKPREGDLKLSAVTGKLLNSYVGTCAVYMHNQNVTR